MDSNETIWFLSKMGEYWVINNLKLLNTKISV